MVVLLRTLVLALLVCSIQFQMFEARLLPNFDHMAKAAKRYEEHKMEKIKTALENVRYAVSSVALHVEHVVELAINIVKAQVITLIEKAKADGVTATECATTANTNLTRITETFEAGLEKCTYDFVSAFPIYSTNVENDFDKINQTILNGTKQAARCPKLDIPCHWYVYYNVKKAILPTEEDMHVQTVDAKVAGIRVVENITNCYAKDRDQAKDEVVKIVPATIGCIAKKKEEKKPAHG